MAQPERIAIVGSRNFSPLAWVRLLVESLPPGTIVISGAGGPVDLDAAHYARRRRLLVFEHRPDWNKHGKAAGPIRNRRIVEDCDRVFAFWDGKSRGTKSTIDIANKLGRPIRVFRSGNAVAELDFANYLRECREKETARGQ